MIKHSWCNLLIGNLMANPLHRPWLYSRLPTSIHLSRMCFYSRMCFGCKLLAAFVGFPCEIISWHVLAMRRFIGRTSVSGTIFALLIFAVGLSANKVTLTDGSGRLSVVCVASILRWLNVVFGYLPCSDSDNSILPGYRFWENHNGHWLDMTGPIRYRGPILT